MKQGDVPTDPDVGLVNPLELIGRSSRPTNYDRVFAVGCGLSPAS